MQDFDWNDLRYVLAVARGGRLAAAARRLGVDETTVSRRLTRLEHALGSRLFQRVDGRLVATDIGRNVVREAEDIETRTDRISQIMTGADANASGMVRLTAVPMLLNRLLVPALPRLLNSHPRLELHLIAEPRNLTLGHREADVALRFGRPEREQMLVARRIANLGYCVYGPDPATRRPLPWITYDSLLSKLPHSDWMAKAIRDEPDAAASVVVNDSDVVVHAIRAGLGRSLLPTCIGDRVPGLARLDRSGPVLFRELWLLVHPELRQLARTSAVVDWISQVVEESNRA